MIPGEADFEADITILTEEEGGRRTPAFNGIRFAFLYDGDSIEDGMYDIWPELIDSVGNVIPSDVLLSGTLHARMYFIAIRLADSVHRHRIKTGVKFFAMEGSHLVARGIVTKVTGLLSNSRRDC
jgi:translation elongation factor EF-Tu-like GTPase